MSPRLHGSVPTVVPVPASCGDRPVRTATAAAASAPGGDEAGGSALAPLLCGAALLGLGGLLLSQALVIAGEGFEPDGPRLFPLVVAVLLVTLASAYLLQQVVALVRRTDPLPAERFGHLPAAAALLGLLVGYAFALAPLGYAVATAGFFVGAARLLGSRQVVRDVATGVGLSVGVYLVFTRALGVFLPQGVFPL